MSTFHSLPIQSIRSVANDAIELTFSVPLELSEQYTAVHGQFVLLRTEIDDVVVERAYSVCSAPYERKLSVAIKRVAEGVFSNHALNQLAEGDVIDVSTPRGEFTCELSSAQPHHFLLLAAGSGITPIISILKMILASEPQSHCTLFYGNKTLADAMFVDELRQLQQRYGARCQIEWVFSRESAEGLAQRITQQLQPGQSGGLLTPHQGRIDAKMVQASVGVASYNKLDACFVCGPDEMALSLREHMLEQGVAEDKIKVELFSNAALEATDEVSSGSQVRLIIDGEELGFAYDDPTESLLEQALRLDGDLPYGCQNGSCGACQAKVISGSVDMATNYALSQSEVDEGYVLMCQARPNTQKLEISYDE